MNQAGSRECLNDMQVTLPDGGWHLQALASQKVLWKYAQRSLFYHFNRGKVINEKIECCSYVI